MPVYEYVCRGCRHGFETLVLGSDVPSCPRCRATELERVLSVTAIGRSASTAPRPAQAMGGGCGSCGDPRGPGACALD
ncbi:MAG: zinc ribbon domain-containing protein [Deltaproteobacteria bacterium]|nr:zinc ribbon domain-containing protein [Deltaproteobacteria bacterium]